ncbi:hypothetical protein C8R46DRAFT_1203168 [Mycena filopes]|nr:hypothetical protein C8R46DRAFT_1203168 [Mycena filopes]
MADVQMPAESDERPALTPAQKRQLTIARATEKARQEQKAFEVESKAANGGRGGRTAKRTAQDNPVWNADKPATRKHTSSTAEASEKIKKPRKSAAPDVDEAASVAQPEVTVSVSSSSFKRKYAAPVISDSESDATPPVSVLPKSKAPAGKPKQKSVAKITAPAKTQSLPTTKSKASAAKPKLPPAKIIADSESEAEASSDEESDSNMVDFDDANDAEFLVEVPRVVAAKKSADTHAMESGSDDDSKMAETKGAEQLIDSDASIEIDKPRRRPNPVQPEPDSDDDLPGAPPRRALNDDDRMLHEAIADGLVTIPRGHHSRRSSTSSWSSGRDLRVPDSDPEDDDEPAVKKPRKVSATRQKQADLEKPEVRAPPPPVKREQDERDVEVPLESSYHLSARIVYPAAGKHNILLNSQSEEIQGVCRGAIINVKHDVLFKNAYPPILVRSGFSRKEFIVVARTRPEYIHILDRLLSDRDFAAILADIILDRINILRGEFKRAAVAVVPGLFQFAGLSEAKTKELVETLLKDHRYIFNVDARGRIRSDQPFMHPAFPAVIKQAAFNHSFKTNNMQHLTSTSTRYPNRKELPYPMVALAGTVIYASLLEYRPTGERININFTEGAYEDTYINHMKTLTETAAWAPKATHQLMHSLFNQITDNKLTHPDAGSSATLINLVEADDSD